MERERVKDQQEEKKEEIGSEEESRSPQWSRSRSATPSGQFRLAPPVSPPGPEDGVASPPEPMPPIPPAPPNHPPPNHPAATIKDWGCVEVISVRNEAWRQHLNRARKESIGAEPVNPTPCRIEGYNCLPIKSQESTRYSWHPGIHPSIIACTRASNHFKQLCHDALRDLARLHSRLQERKRSGQTMQVVFHCNQGRHRSVSAAEVFAEKLRSLGAQSVTVRHTEEAGWSPRCQQGKCPQCGPRWLGTEDPPAER